MDIKNHEYPALVKVYCYWGPNELDLSSVWMYSNLDSYYNLNSLNPKRKTLIKYLNSRQLTGSFKTCIVKMHVNPVRERQVPALDGTLL